MNRRQVSERSSSNSAFELSDPAPDHVVTEQDVATDLLGERLGHVDLPVRSASAQVWSQPRLGQSFPIDGCTWPGSSSS